MISTLKLTPLPCSPQRIIYLMIFLVIEAYFISNAPAMT